MQQVTGICRVCTESWILEEVLNFAQQFSRPEKSLENGDKEWKNGKKSWVFFSCIQSYNKCSLEVKYYLFWWNLFQYCLCVHSAPYKKLCSCIFYVSIDHLKYLIILSLEKEIIVVEKSVENYKSWILDPKIGTDPVHILQVKFYFRFILIKPRLMLNFQCLLALEDQGN